MVDPITIRPVTGKHSAAVATPSVAPRPGTVPAPADKAQALASPLSALIADYAAKPPIDEERVARIRHAIATNSYPITPETIADRLLALKLNWNANDPS